MDGGDLDHDNDNADQVTGDQQVDSMDPKDFRVVMDM